MRKIHPDCIIAGMGRVESKFDQWEEDREVNPPKRGGKSNNGYNMKKGKTMPDERPQGTGRFAYLHGSGEPTPETPQERMLRMLHAQHPDTTHPIPQANVSQSELRKTLNSKKSQR